TSSVAPVPEVTTSSVAPVSEVTTSSVAPVPAVTTSSAAPVPEVTTSSAAPVPEVTTSSVAPVPEVTTSSVSPVPEIVTPSTTEISEESSTATPEATSTESVSAVEPDTTSVSIPSFTSTEEPTVETPSVSTTPVVVIPVTTTSSNEAPETLSTLIPTETTAIETSSTGANTATTTSNWLPTSLITAATTVDVDATTTTSVRTTDLPKVLAPADQVSASDLSKNYTLITVGFKKAFNYPFVVKNALSSAQIFEYLPGVLNGPYDFVNPSTTIYQLVPFSSTDVDYIITVAEVYFPSSEVESLQQNILNLTSPLYTNSDQTLNELAKLIDPSVPITGLLTKLQSSTSSSSSSGDGSSSDSDDSDGSSSSGSKVSIGSLDSGSMDYSATVSTNVTPETGKRAIAITIGSVAGGISLIAACVVGLYFGFLRKKKIELIESAHNSMYSEGSLESGYYSINGESLHEKVESDKHFISRPVESKNSLGWV
ncbi:hypothetical protein WICPIJ_000053, partial [Wickerhamomyces pijperi]